MVKCVDELKEECNVLKTLLISLFITAGGELL